MKRARRHFLYFTALTTCLIVSVVLYKTPNVVNALPYIKVISSSSTNSQARSSNLTALAKSQRKKFAIFASSIHSKLHAYTFYSPITAAAWQRIGYQVIVVFVGDFTNNSNASLSSRLNLARQFLQRLNVHVIDFQCNASHAIKVSQLVRVFAGFLSYSWINDDDHIITTDSDIIPIRRNDYILAENIDGFIYNAFCCGSFIRRGKTYQMYPMSHICLSKRTWRNLLLESVQRQELLNSTLLISDAVLLSEKAPFSFDTISLYVRQEFQHLYDSNMTKGDAAWYMDQVYVSMLLNDYCKKHANFTINKYTKLSPRVDPNMLQTLWEPQKLKQYGDAHVIHDEIFDSHRWASFKNLLIHLFNTSLVNDFDLYYKAFVLTLQNKPDESQ